MGVTPWCVWTVLTDLSVWVRVGSGRSTTYYPVSKQQAEQYSCARLYIVLRFLYIASVVSPEPV